MVGWGWIRGGGPAHTFSEGDEHYPAGWYLRNPPGSHRPSSHEGDVIFVKLQQMRTGERDRVHIDTRDLSSWQRQDDREVCPLFSSVAEQVCLQHLVPGALLFDGPVGGAEYLVLAGEVLEQGRSYERGTWMRLPEGEYLATAAGQQGATVYLKTGHLAGMAVEA